MPELIPAVLLVGVVVAVATGFMGQGAASNDAAYGRAVATAVLAAGGTTIVGCFVVAGLVVLAGPAAWAIIVSLMVLAAPAAWWRLQQRRHRDADAAVTREENPTVPPVRPAHAPEVLTTPQLCLAWQRSYFALLDLPAGPDRCEVARVREPLLDELERRDRDGFAGWLDSDARPGSNPGPPQHRQPVGPGAPGMTGLV